MEDDFNIELKYYKKRLKKKTKLWYICWIQNDQEDTYEQKKKKKF